MLHWCTSSATLDYVLKLTLCQFHRFIIVCIKSRSKITSHPKSWKNLTLELNIFSPFQSFFMLSAFSYFGPSSHVRSLPETFRRALVGSILWFLFVSDETSRRPDKPKCTVISEMSRNSLVFSPERNWAVYVIYF